MGTTTFRSKSKEHIIQCECIAWFRNEYERKGRGIIISVVNEATYQDKAQQSLIKAGCSDLIVVLNGRVIFVELKDARGTQREDQIAFQAQLSILGYRYYLVRSLEAFKAAINANI